MGGASRKRVPFAPSPHDVVDKMLSIADPSSDELLVDLGSGDGRIVISASRDYRCKAIGVEINPELLRLSREKVMKISPHRARIIQGDLHQFDFSKADVITLYLLPSTLKMLKPKLTMLKREARIVSHDYAVPGLEPDEVCVVKSRATGRRHVIYLYVM